MALVVNGAIVSDSAIAEQYALLAQAFSVGTNAALNTIAQQRLQQIAEESAIFQAILYQHAAKSGFKPSTKEIMSAVSHRGRTSQSTVSASESALVERQLKIDHFIHHVTRSVPRPSTRELKAMYERSITHYREPERLHVRHIIKNVDELNSDADARSCLQAAQQVLRSGARFERVADEFSDCSGNGGDLGWIARKEMVQEFEEQVFAMRPGEISEIFTTRFGLHIATLEARRPARTRPFPEVRLELAESVLTSRRQTALLAYLRQEAEQADIRPFREAGELRP